MRVLVTGANGFIGRHACVALLRRGHDVVALRHRRRDGLDAIIPMVGQAEEHPSTSPSQREGTLTVEDGDILDTQRLVEVCRRHRVEGVCHLAVHPPDTANPQLARRVNVEGTLSLLEACRDAEVNRCVYASSMSVYNFLSPAYLPVDEEHPVEPLQPYGEEKLMGETCCEQYAHDHRIDTPVLRLTGVYGPGKITGAVYNFIAGALQNQAIQIDVNRKVDLLYVEDAASVTVTALERAGGIGFGIFNIGAGRSITLKELAEIIRRKVGGNLQITCGEEGNEFYVDISRAMRLLDFVPTPLECALERCIRWMREESRTEP
jgi:nucleoside-diphosphate-sugar epimerase